MPAVTIRPTFKKDSRPNNGLEDAADAMQADKTRLFRVVGTMKYAGASISEEGEITPAAKFVTLEVVYDDEDIADVVRLTDKRRRARGLGDEKDIPAVGQLAGQIEFDYDGADDEGAAGTRLGPDGEHEVPPPSAEEELAEREERRAIEAKLNQDVITELTTGDATARPEWGEREEAKAAGVPQAAFSGGTE